MKLPGFVLVMLFAAGAARAQAPASIQGFVVKWGTNEPIPQAMVELRNPADASGTPLMTTATRSNGEYVLQQVPPGRYRIFATRAEYAPAEYGQKRLSGAGAPVTVVAGESLSNAQIQMSPTAAISGRVTNAKGDPMAVVRVQLSRLTFRNGGAELVPQQSTYTNDLGEYRLFWITPGSYYVSAENAQNNTSPQMLLNPAGNSSSFSTQYFAETKPRARILRDTGTDEGQIYVPIYYRGSPDWRDAQPLELHPGDDLPNINVTLNPALERHVSGQVVDGATGQTVQEGIVVSLRQLDSSLPSPPRTLQFFPDNGKFQFVVTQPGTYEVRATVGTLAGRAMTALRDRETEVSVPVFPPMNVSGQVSFETAAGTGAPPPGLSVTLRAAGVQPVSSPVAANGTFLFERVPVAAYQVAMVMPELPDAYVKSMRMGNVDVLGEELAVDGLPMGQLQIVVGLEGGSVEGRVVSPSQQPVRNSTVVIVPEGMRAFRADRYRSATVDSSGVFEFRGLAPGDYAVYAWEDVESGAWFNPAFLQNYENYKRTLRIVDGQRQILEVLAAPGL